MGRWFLGCPAYQSGPGKDGFRIDVSMASQSYFSRSLLGASRSSDTRDTRETISPFYNRENIRRNTHTHTHIYIYIYIYYFYLFISVGLVIIKGWLYICLCYASNNITYNNHYPYHNTEVIS